MRDLVEAALDPERERRGVRARRVRRRRRRRSVRARDERQGARAEARATRTSCGPTGSTRRTSTRAPPTSRASRASRCATRRSATSSASAATRSPAAARCTRGTTCSGAFRGADRRQDRPHGRRRLVPGRRGAQTGVHRLHDDSRQSVARAAERRPRGAAQVGSFPIPCLERDQAGTHVRARAGGLRTRRRWSSSPASRRPPRRSRRQAARRARRRSGRGRASGARGRTARRDPPLLGQAPLAARPLVACRSIQRPGRRWDASASTRGGPLKHIGSWFSMIVTVTLNAALDRTLTVPNFQLGQRHRASAGLDARRRQGDQRRAHAQGARRPGRRDRPRRRPHRARASSRT